MIKLDLSQIKPIPGFDSLKWKRKVHTKILREIKGMTDEEERAYFRQAAEHMRKEREQYQAKLAKLAESADSDKP